METGHPPVDRSTTTSHLYFAQSNTAMVFLPMARIFRFLRWFLLASIAFCTIGLLAAGALVYTVNARLPDVQGLRSDCTSGRRALTA